MAKARKEHGRPGRVLGLAGRRDRVAAVIATVRVTAAQGERLMDWAAAGDEFAPLEIADSGPGRSQRRGRIDSELAGTIFRVDIVNVPS